MKILNEQIDSKINLLKEELDTLEKSEESNEDEIQVSANSSQQQQRMEYLREQIENLENDKIESRENHLEQIDEYLREMEDLEKKTAKIHQETDEIFELLKESDGSQTVSSVANEVEREKEQPTEAGPAIARQPSNHAQMVPPVKRATLELNKNPSQIALCNSTGIRRSLLGSVLLSKPVLQLVSKIATGIFLFLTTKKSIKI